MKHPVRSDFDTAVTEAGVNVTFKPTNSIYSFYRLAESEDIARLGPSRWNVSDTRGRVAIPRTILLMKFKTWRSVSLRMSARPFGQFKTRKRPTN
jgi:hypothetical protein